LEVLGWKMGVREPTPLYASVETFESHPFRSQKIMEKGFDFRLRTNARYFLDDELLKDLKRVAVLYNKKSISQKEYKEKGKFSPHTFYNRFGSWNNALTKAGLKVKRTMNISEEDLFNNLEIIWRKLGRQLFYEEMRKPFSKYSIDVYCRRFGGWQKACKAFIKYKKKDPRFEKLLKLKNIAQTRTINEKIRLQVLKRDDYKCQKCGKSPATHRNIYLHIDHIKPFSKGGDNSIENLRTLCNKCNLGRGNDENLLKWKNQNTIILMPIHTLSIFCRSQKGSKRP